MFGFLFTKIFFPALYSGASMGIKIGTGFGSAFIGWGLALGGYVGGQAVQADSALFTINVLFIHLPIILSTLMIILLFLFKLDKQYPQILRELKERNASV
jgi:GPH family glycoside/pentoside/hexuronide:cation symporter